MLSSNIDDYKIGDKVLFHDENQCEIRGNIRGKRYQCEILYLTIEQDDGSYYDAQIPKAVKAI